ncbi:MAG TPA: pitrilysin family protein [Bacilli bacterium]|nr:pitrilysin family protein [Bacilli bacterium]
MIIHSTVLENGLRIVIAEVPEMPVVSAGLFFRQGSRNEADDENGISHYLEHLLFNNQRAIRRKKRAVESILFNGGVLSAFTTKECTSYEGVALKQHAHLLFESLYELVFEGEFSAEDVEAERPIILAELKRKTAGSDQITDYLVQGIYGNTGYGKWILGTEDFISSVQVDQLRERYEKSYCADNCSLVVLTSLEVRELMPMITELYSRVPSGTPTPLEVNLSEEVHLKVLRQKSEQVYLCLGGVGPSSRDESTAMFEMAMAAWGSLPNSRLFLSARERDGLVYQIQSFSRHYVQTGQWGVFSSVSRKNFEPLMAVLAEEIHRLREEPLSEAELSRTASVLKTDLYLKMQQTGHFLKLLGRKEIFRETIYPNDLIRQLELATPERVMESVRDSVRPLGTSLVVMGDLDTDQALQAMNLIGE